MLVINRDGLGITQPGRLEELYFNTPANESIAAGIKPTNVINRDGLAITQPGRLEELYFNTPVNESIAADIMPTNVQQGLAPLYNAMLNPPTYGESTVNLQPMTLSEKKFMFQKNLENKKQKKGIGNLLKTAVGFMIPGANLIMSGGLQNLNQRMRNSDFGQATSFADYLDMQRYGGAQGRRDAAARTMAQARGLQKQMAQRPSGQVTAEDQYRGGASSLNEAASRSAAKASAQKASRSAGISSARGSNFGSRFHG